MEYFIPNETKTVEQELCSKCKKSCTCSSCAVKNITDLDYEVVVTLLCKGLSMEEIEIAKNLNLFKHSCSSST